MLPVLLVHTRHYSDGPLLLGPHALQDDPEEWLWDDVPTREESPSCSSSDPVPDWAQLSNATQNRMDEVPPENSLEPEKRYIGIPADLPWEERWPVFQMLRRLGIYKDTPQTAAIEVADKAAAAAGEGVSLESLVRAPGNRQEGARVVRRGLEVWVAATAIQHAHRRLVAESKSYLGEDPKRKEEMQRAILYS